VKFVGWRLLRLGAWFLQDRCSWCGIDLEASGFTMALFCESDVDAVGDISVC